MSTDRSENMKRYLRSKPQDKAKVKVILRRNWIADLEEYGIILPQMLERRD